MRELHGSQTYAHHRNQPEVEYSVDIPDPPAALGRDARAEWDRVTAELRDKRLIARVDLAVVSTYCTLFGRLQETQRLLKDPKVQAGSKKWERFARIERQTAAQLKPYAVELGFSPASRARVHPLPEPEPAAAKDDFASMEARLTGKVVSIGRGR